MNPEEADKVLALFRDYANRVQAELHSCGGNLYHHLAEMCNVPEEKVREAMNMQLFLGKLPTFSELNSPDFSFTADNGVKILEKNINEAIQRRTD